MARVKRPTMADVAALAGVSLSTVSLTYSGAGPISAGTKARVERAATELGYGGPSPHGRALRSGRSGIIGVVIHEKFARSFRDPLNLRILDSLIADFGAMGLGVLLIPQPTPEDGDKSLISTAAMDAVVVLRVRDHEEPALELANRRGIPLVVMEGHAPAGAGSLDIDDTNATVTLINHLKELGHTRIGTVTLPFGTEADTRIITRAETNRPAWTPIHHRLDAFELAGIEPCVIVEAHASMVESGLAAGHLALNHPSAPTAIVCQSDLLAGGVILAAREKGLTVPDDLSVTGFDGLDLPWIAPAEVTTMKQDGAIKGHVLAKEVKALLDGKEPERVVLPLEFRRGNTTAVAPA